MVKWNPLSWCHGHSSLPPSPTPPISSTYIPYNEGSDTLLLWVIMSFEHMSYSFVSFLGAIFVVNHLSRWCHFCIHLFYYYLLGRGRTVINLNWFGSVRSGTVRSGWAKLVWIMWLVSSVLFGQYYVLETATRFFMHRCNFRGTGRHCPPPLNPPRSHI